MDRRPIGTKKLPAAFYLQDTVEVDRQLIQLGDMALTQKQGIPLKSLVVAQHHIPGRKRADKIGIFSPLNLPNALADKTTHPLFLLPRSDQPQFLRCQLPALALLEV